MSRACAAAPAVSGAASPAVNLLSFEGARYLVAPRGQTQWVRNLCVAGSGELRVGRRIEAFSATELADDERADVLRAYPKRKKFEVGAYFGEVKGSAPEPELRRIAPNHPCLSAQFADLAR